MDMLCAKIDVIICAMQRSRLTPREIAEKSGVTVNVVYRMRKGFLVRMERFEKVCLTLEIDCNDVIDFERVEAYREQMLQKRMGI